MDRSNTQRIGLSLIAIVAFAVSVHGEDEPIRVRTYLRPTKSIEISTTEIGLIQQLLVRPGDEVEAGDVLLKLNSAVIEAQLAQAKARTQMGGKLKATEAEYALAKNRYELMKKLKTQGSSNQAELDRGIASLQIAEGNLDAVKEELAFSELEVKRMEVELAKRSLKSPITGVVVEVVRDESETIGMRLENEEPYLIRVVDLSKLRAEAHVPYELARNYKVGDALSIQLRTPESPILDGVVEYVARVVDPATGTVEIHVVYESDSNEILSGLPGDLLLGGAGASRGIDRE